MNRRAYSAAELVVCIAIVLAVGAVASPGLLATRDALRADGATDYLMGVLRDARMEALRRRANVAVRFEPDGHDIALATYVDGNGNGVRATDITAGIDTLVRPRERIGDQFPTVAFGVETGVPDVDGAPLPDTDPVRVGRSRMLSFSPTGTSSSGTVYLLMARRRASAVRVLGVTGRVRSLVFDRATARWVVR